MRIGLYGGSFDPVHLGHLFVAEAAREELGLDRLVFIPAAQSPFKAEGSLATGVTRAAMLRLALAGWSWCEVDELELRRGGPSYTIATVRELAAREPGAEWFWLLGEDHVAALPQWREAAELARRVVFAVIPRPGVCGGEATPEGFHVLRLKGFPLGVSASDIRRRVHARQPWEVLVPGPVAEFICNNGLYL